MRLKCGVLLTIAFLALFPSLVPTEHGVRDSIGYGDCNGHGLDCQDELGGALA
jgi:hypothetical protein